MSNLPLPAVVEIEPTAACNIRCRMCHVSFMPEGSRPPLLEPALIDRLSSLREAHMIVASNYEPAMHPGLADILERLARIGCPYEMVTNGTILTDRLLKALTAGNVRLLTFSFDGATRETYEYIRRGADFARTLRNIRRIRESFAGRDTLFAVNATVLRANLEEIPAMMELWDDFDFDLIRFIAMVIRERDPWLVRQSLYPVRDRYHAFLERVCDDAMARPRRIGVRSKQLGTTRVPERYPRHCRDLALHSDHPRARRIPHFRSLPQLGDRPGMWFGCRSPWTFARILNDGAVQLCYRYTIGNLHDASFEEIWNGAAANAVRRTVAADRAICPSCDYFRFCLSDTVDSENVDNYFAGHLASLVERIDFETGEIRAGAAPGERMTALELRARPPRLVEEGRRGFNIVEYRGRYFGLAQSLGPIDVAGLDEAWLAERPYEALVDPSLQVLTRRIDSLPGF